ncbi:MAG: urea transporter [Chloroflexi bacterium]|nr:urea transporter [Chloroflexota bacterium]
MTGTVPVQSTPALVPESSSHIHVSESKRWEGARSFGGFLLNGYSFMLFWNRPAVGAGLAVILFLLNPWAGATGLLGNAVATAVARYVLKVRTGLIRYGLFGANGMFVGLAWAVFLPAGLTWLVLPLALAALSAVVTYLLVNTLSLRLSLPVLVIPFVLVTWLLFGVSQFLPGAYTWRPVLLSPWWANIEDGISAWLVAPLSGFFDGLGQLLYANSLVLGAVIFAVWLARARLPALAAFLGYLTSWAALELFGGANIDPGVRSWASVNGALTGFCLGGVFLSPSIASFIYGALGAAGAAWLTTLALPALAALHFPVLVSPFLAVTVLLVLLIGLPLTGVAARKLGLVRIPLAHIGHPGCPRKKRRPPERQRV